MHLPRFEQISAMKHHCGICKTPFSNPNALSTCIGKHEVICARFHFMFHFVGKAHTCKACSNTDQQEQKRHRAIILLIQDFYRENGEDVVGIDVVASPVTPTESPHPEKLKKKQRKAQKQTAKTSLKLDIVKQSDLLKLERVIYGLDEAAEDADEALADALAVKFLPNVFSEKRMLDTLMAPPRDKPNLDAEAERVVTMLGLINPQSKAARAIVDKIKLAVQEDIDIRWKTELEMKKRRIIYAQWVTQGAVANMATHYEDWDINTGARTNRRYKGDDRDQDTRIYEDDLDRFDDFDDAISEVTNLTRASTLESEDEPQTPRASTTKFALGDTRRGGNAIIPSPSLATPKAWNDENYAADPINITPTLRIITRPKRNELNPWGTISKPAPIDLSVKPLVSSPAPNLGYTLDLSSPLSFKTPRTPAWAASPSPQAVSPSASGEDTLHGIEDMLEESPPPKMAAAVRVLAKPVIVDEPLDEGWTAVGKKGKAKSGGQR